MKGRIKCGAGREKHTVLMKWKLHSNMEISKKQKTWQPNSFELLASAYEPQTMIMVKEIVCLSISLNAVKRCGWSLQRRTQQRSPLVQKNLELKISSFLLSYWEQMLRPRKRQRIQLNYMRKMLKYETGNYNNK